MQGISRLDEELAGFRRRIVRRAIIYLNIAVYYGCDLGPFVLTLWLHFVASEHFPLRESVRAVAVAARSCTSVLPHIRCWRVYIEKLRKCACWLHRALSFGLLVVTRALCNEIS